MTEARVRGTGGSSSRSLHWSALNSPAVALYAVAAFHMKRTFSQSSLAKVSKMIVSALQRFKPPAFFHAKLMAWVLQLSLVAAFVGIPEGLLRADSSASRFEVKNYVITAELLPSQHLITAQARIDIVPDSDLTSLGFELHSNLRVEKVVDSNGQQVNFSQNGQALNLSLLNPLSANK